MRKYQPYALGIFIGTISLAALTVLERFSTAKVMLPVLFVWVCIVASIAWIFQRADRIPKDVFWQSITTILCMTGLIIVVEVTQVRVFLSLLTAGILAILFGWYLISPPEISYSHKPLRRFAMMLWVFDVYALFTFIFALGAFFPSSILFIVLNIFSGFFIAAVTIMIWSEYFAAKVQSFFIWTVIVSIATMELMWVLHLLPFAYTVLGLLLVWIWYIIQLLVRFHFSTKGILWKSQIKFLIVNSILYIALLVFFVRWV
ncbi:MAG: hypothetical protein COU35_01630 [Candidatus Magasanikbacteria bacterium CG10_big_fil_rev_8_21_14_0_10_47_10]|uniref:Uncharacterized protein n=1 Tax=Candidatus Magasanikbacteria bacterium CG10_big_fil_rev_8_21_14_0_10_47_10 TaxID=1974652 RepID=A0A2H0TQY6_9BACT|nr:MAG: hypothetical protein COU35_01630 [Candidatus Magasanikbacteria bacterium CG10_big_fil_rev_8_21_14_0_10_47_10]